MHVPIFMKSCYCLSCFEYCLDIPAMTALFSAPHDNMVYCRAKQ